MIYCDTENKIHYIRLAYTAGKSDSPTNFESAPFQFLAITEHCVIKMMNQLLLSCLLNVSCQVPREDPTYEVPETSRTLTKEVAEQITLRKLFMFSIYS